MDDNRKLFYSYAEQLAETGIAVFLPQYRVYRQQGVTPKTCLIDVLAGLAEIEKEFRRLDVSPDQIVWGGGSAGAQLLLCAALISESNIYIPSKMFFYNPVCCPHSLHNWIKDECNKEFDFKGICPLHDMKRANARILIMHGTDDEIAPYSDAILFAEKYRAFGGECEVIPYQGRKHGFHHKSTSIMDYDSTLQKTIEFIRS